MKWDRKKSPEDRNQKPISAGMASTPAKPVCFSAYVMRQKEGWREIWKVESERQQEWQRGSSGINESKAEREMLRETG